MMLSIPQAIILGAFQGISELFPISSLGHSVLIPSLLGWNINQNDPFFLIFLVVTHFATALVLFIFFWKDWVKIVGGILYSLKIREIKQDDTYAKLGWLLVVGTIPAGLLGILFEDTFKSFFSAPQIVAVFLFLNGLMLLLVEILKRKKSEKSDITHSDKRIAKMNWLQSIKIGTMQSIALFPGFSRTGATITGGLLVGLSHEDAARFAFLLATPIIGAAALLKIPELLLSANSQMILVSLVGGVFAALFAYLSVKFLVKYFQTKTLIPFAIYCLIVGSIFTIYFLVR